MELDHAAAAHRTCRSACRRSWSSSVPTCARPRRSCTRPAPRSASPSPISCRRSASAATIGNAARRPRSLFTPGSGIWSIGASARAADLSTAGTLLHRATRRGRRLRRGGRAVSQHRAARPSRTWPTRCARCRPTPTALSAPGRPPSQAAAAASISRRSSTSLGAITYLTLLNAQRTYQQARDQPACRRRRRATPTPRRCSRRWAAAGGTAPTCGPSRGEPERVHRYRGRDRHDAARRHR